MKTIYNVTVYECDWCKKRSLLQISIKYHEKQCPKNPNKKNNK